MSRSPKCEECRFWEAFDEDDKDSLGWCQRYPPMLHNITPKEDQCDESDWQPRVRRSDWCGEFRSENPKFDGPAVGVMSMSQVDSFLQQRLNQRPTQAEQEQINNQDDGDRP
jgi:hypothetical protein